MPLSRSDALRTLATRTIRRVADVGATLRRAAARLAAGRQPSGSTRRAR